MQNVINNFKNLCKIPHCSFDTKKMQDFLVSYAKEKKYKVSVDKSGNIHCIKGNPKICLQSHYDMVCMGDAPNIRLIEENNILKAENSSLGADNGIGVSIMMSAMDKFDNLECLFTNDEEVGLIGANNLEHKIQSKKLLNLDHESDNEVIIGCAGGVDLHARLKYDLEDDYGDIYELEAVNFKGGHSGINIIDNVKNSIKQMAKFISLNNGKIIHFEGGERINSIPKYAKALVCFENKPNNMENIICKFKEKNNFKFCKQYKNILNSINSFAQGVRTYNKELNIVQSSINLSLLKMIDNEIQIDLFARANFLDDLKQIEFEIYTLFESQNFTLNSSNFYPPWECNKNDFSLEVLQILKEEVKDAKILAIHAGLECGIIEKSQDVLCASIGPNIYYPHSIDEYCEIDSVEKISKVVFKLLEKAQS